MAKPIFQASAGGFIAVAFVEVVGQKSKAQIGAIQKIPLIKTTAPDGEIAREQGNTPSPHTRGIVGGEDVFLQMLKGICLGVYLPIADIL